MTYSDGSKKWDIMHTNKDIVKNYIGVGRSKDISSVIRCSGKVHFKNPFHVSAEITITSQPCPPKIGALL